MEKEVQQQQPETLTSIINTSGRALKTEAAVTVKDDNPPTVFTSKAYLTNNHKTEEPIGITPSTSSVTTTAAATTSAADADATTPTTITWALVTPPGLLGGYRNQVIRLFGMVIGAANSKVTQFLLPSILWSTNSDEGEGRSVPMEDVFDIEHWNSFYPQLPKLVETVQGTSDCWYDTVDDMRKENSELVQTLTSREDAPLHERLLVKPRFLKPIANISLAYATGELKVNPRRFDVSPQIQHCKNPTPYGSGGGPRGLLWTTYMGYQRKRKTDQPDPLERVFLQALRPSPKWRALAQQCVKEATSTKSTPQDNSPQPYVALHPRIELEMMNHGCGTFMNKNMSKILEDVGDFLLQQQQEMISGIFVALHRAGASVQEGKPYENRFKAYIDENIRTMDRVLGTNSSEGEGLAVADRNLPVFECGDKLLESYYQQQQPNKIRYGSLLPSILNFDVAVEASIFIGFRFSSWSNSVWTTRYYLGRGATNYEYTRERGIQPIGNGGLPPPHQNCDKIQDPGRR